MDHSLVPTHEELMAVKHKKKVREVKIERLFRIVTGPRLLNSALVRCPCLSDI